MGQPVPEWGAVFDTLSARYDQSGVPFFGPIAQALVERLAVAPGQRVAELGCGRGALTLLLAEAVGPGGRIDALDLSAEMVALAQQATAALPQVEVVRGDAAAPPFAEASYDVVAASLVLFFLPDPLAAVRRWRSLVGAAGRAGVTTFAEPTRSWRAVDAAFDDALGRPASSGPYRGPFADDAGVEALFRAGGWAEVRARVAQVLDDEGGRLQVAIRHTLASS